MVHQQHVQDLNCLILTSEIKVVQTTLEKRDHIITIISTDSYLYLHLLCNNNKELALKATLYPKASFSLLLVIFLISLSLF